MIQMSYFIVNMRKKKVLSILHMWSSLFDIFGKYIYKIWSILHKKILYYVRNLIKIYKLKYLYLTYNINNKLFLSA